MPKCCCNDQTICIIYCPFKYFYKEVLGVPKKYRFLRRHSTDIVVISIIYLSSFFNWWFTNEAEHFAFETWLHNSSIFSEIHSHEDLSRATIYRFCGSEAVLALILVAVIIFKKWQNKAHSFWNGLLILGLALQILFPICVFIFWRFHSHIGISRLRLYFIGRFLFGMGIALSATYSVTYLYKYSFKEPLNVRRRILGSLNTFSMLGDFFGLWLSYLRFIEKISDITWLFLLSGVSASFSCTAIVFLSWEFYKKSKGNLSKPSDLEQNESNSSIPSTSTLTLNVSTTSQEDPNQTSALSNKPKESNSSIPSTSTVTIHASTSQEDPNQINSLTNELNESDPLMSTSSTVPINISTLQEEKTFSYRDPKILKALLSSVVLQILVILCRDMWRWNFEEIFKLMDAPEKEIDEWILATAFCSIFFVVTSSKYLPHSFEPLKKIRYTASINLSICILALVAKNLKSTRFLGLSAVAHYSFGSLSIEAFNELLPSFFHNEKELEFGFTLANLCRFLVEHFMVVMHLKEVTDFVVLIIVMSLMQILMIRWIPIIEKWLEDREDIAHYTDIGDIMQTCSCIDEDDKLNIIAPITKILEYVEGELLSLKVKDKTGEIRVDINLELYEVNQDQRQWMREIYEDQQNVKNLILCLRKSMIKKRYNTITIINLPVQDARDNNTTPNLLEHNAFAIFSCNKFVYGQEDQFHLHDHDWALVSFIFYAKK